MSNLTRGYNQIVNNEYYTRFTNPFKNFNSNIFNNNCKKTGRDKGQFVKKNVLPFNHWRKETVYKNRVGLNCPTNQVIFKDPLALTKDTTCNKHCKKTKNNPNFIFSHSSLNENRHRTFNQNLKILPHNNFKDKTDNFLMQNQRKKNKSVIKYSNPTFRKTGAVSSRNRIAALKNGNNNKYTQSNMYNKRCDNMFVYYKKKDAPKIETLCRPPNYRGGKYKTALLRCQPK